MHAAEAPESFGLTSDSCGGPDETWPRSLRGRCAAGTARSKCFRKPLDGMRSHPPRRSMHQTGRPCSSVPRARAVADDKGLGFSNSVGLRDGSRIATPGISIQAARRQRTKAGCSEVGAGGGGEASLGCPVSLYGPQVTNLVSTCLSSLTNSSCLGVSGHISLFSEQEFLNFNSGSFSNSQVELHLYVHSNFATN